MDKLSEHKQKLCIFAGLADEAHIELKMLRRALIRYGFQIITVDGKGQELVNLLKQQLLNTSKEKKEHISLMILSDSMSGNPNVFQTTNLIRRVIFL